MRAKIPLSVAFLLLSPFTSWATRIFFEDVEFVRDGENSQTAIASFSACDPESVFTILVENGQDSQHRVAGGSITLN